MDGADRKSLLALLNGICRLDYLRENEITVEFLRKETFPDIADEEFYGLIVRCRGYVKSMAATNMNLNQAEAFLISQTKKANSNFKEDQAKVFVKFWKQNKAKIHDSLVNKCKWDNQLRTISWRIDIGSRTKTKEELSTTTAIIELELENPDTKGNSEKISFEMDEDKVTEVLNSLKDIEERIDVHSKNHC